MARPILVVSQLMLVTIVHGLFRQAYGAALKGTLLYISSITSGAVLRRAGEET